MPKRQTYTELQQYLPTWIHFTENDTYTPSGVRKLEVYCDKHDHTGYVTATKLKNGATGCKFCGYAALAITKKKPHAQFMKEVTAKWGNTYDYTDSKYTGAYDPFTYICSVHGNITQTAHQHLTYGCRYCGVAIRANKATLSFNTVLERSKRIFGETAYRYPRKFPKGHINNESLISLYCNKHKVAFKVSIAEHLNKHTGCPMCSVRNSTGQLELYNFIRQHAPDVLYNDRSILGNYELDIVIPSIKLSIEYNGLYWHSTLKLPNATTNHRNKSNLATKAGYRLIHIFEDEWLLKRHVVERYLIFLLGKAPRTYARKTTLCKVSVADAKTFYNANHIQGFVGSKFHYGLVHKGNLVACMSFSKYSRGKSEKNTWELVRYATSGSVIGGASKLLKYFMEQHNPNIIVSYCDTRFFTGAMYPKLGFTLNYVSPPEYYPVYKKVRYNRRWAQKTNLAKRFPEQYDTNLSELENCNNIGIHRIYGCGIARYTLVCD